MKRKQWLSRLSNRGLQRVAERYHKLITGWAGMYRPLSVTTSEEEGFNEIHAECLRRYNNGA